MIQNPDQLEAIFTLHLIKWLYSMGGWRKNNQGQSQAAFMKEKKTQTLEKASKLARLKRMAKEVRILSHFILHKGEM